MIYILNIDWTDRRRSRIVRAEVFRMRRMPTIVRATILGFIVAGCGGSQPAAPATPPPAPAEVPSAAPAAPPAADTSAAAPAAPAEPAPAPAAPSGPVWSNDMTKEQKVAFMKANVVPHMEPVFQAQDAKRYKEFSCKTCHGPKFALPKDFLPKLTFKDGAITAFKTKPEMAKFMEEKVTPAMADAMGMKPFDPATKQGFGCMGCHTVNMK
jgi:hypothetical protein